MGVAALLGVPFCTSEVHSKSIRYCRRIWGWTWLDQPVFSVDGVGCCEFSRLPCCMLRWSVTAGGEMLERERVQAERKKKFARFCLWDLCCPCRDRRVCLTFRRRTRRSWKVPSPSESIAISSPRQDKPSGPREN